MRVRGETHTSQSNNKRYGKMCCVLLRGHCLCHATDGSYISEVRQFRRSSGRFVRIDIRSLCECALLDPSLLAGKQSSGSMTSSSPSSSSNTLRMSMCAYVMLISTVDA